MTRLEDLQVNAALRAVLRDGRVMVFNVAMV